MRYRILITGEFGKAGLARLDTMDDIRYDVRPGLSRAGLRERVAEYDALILPEATACDAAVIAAGHNLQVIGRAGATVANIDVAQATRHGIVVTYTPHATCVAIAEHVFALMLAATRQVVSAHNALATGTWADASSWGAELWCKTLGLIGFDYVALLVAQRAQAFGMNVVTHDPHVPPDGAAGMDVSPLPLRELLLQSDIISLHTAVAPSTAAIINAASISAMKDGVIIINVCGGELIDLPALADALHCGKVGSAGLDALRELSSLPNPFLGLPNVVHTPGLGPKTQEAQRRMSVELVQQVADALRGADYRHVVNPVAIPRQTSIAAG